jgi:hypothetical protein
MIIYSKINIIKLYNNGFNLPSDSVPLMGPRRLIPIVKTQYIHWEKPIF